MKKETSFFLFASILVLWAFLFSAGVAEAATLSVGATAKFKTIQSAINAASVGDTVSVAAGTYNESLTINKAITLVGTGKTIITGGSTNTWNYGILITNAGTPTSPVEIKNLEINNIWGDGASAISVEANSYALIHENNISSFHKNGIRFTNSAGKVYGNTIKGDTVDGVTRAQNLINLRDGSNVEIFSNILSNSITLDRTPQKFDSTCIFLSAYPNGVASTANIHNNNLSLCDIGVDISSKTLVNDSSSATVTNNTMSDISTGINFEKSTANADIKDNTYVNVGKEFDSLAGNAQALVNNAVPSKNSFGPTIGFFVVMIVLVAAWAFRRKVA